jgi:hypothetical protein
LSQFYKPRLIVFIPRQARDKHRESTQNERRFLTGMDMLKTHLSDDQVEQLICTRATNTMVLSRSLLSVFVESSEGSQVP